MSDNVSFEACHIIKLGAFVFPGEWLQKEVWSEQDERIAYIHEEETNSMRKYINYVDSSMSCWVFDSTLSCFLWQSFTAWERDKMELPVQCKSRPHMWEQIYCLRLDLIYEKLAKTANENHCLQCLSINNFYVSKWKTNNCEIIDV